MLRKWITLFWGCSAVTVFAVSACSGTPPTDPDPRLFPEDTKTDTGADAGMSATSGGGAGAPATDSGVGGTEPASTSSDAGGTGGTEPMPTSSGAGGTGGTMREPECEPGFEGCECLDGDCLFSQLSCASNRCVDLNTTTGGNPSGSGGTGGMPNTDAGAGGTGGTGGVEEEAPPDMARELLCTNGVVADVSATATCMGAVAPGQYLPDLMPREVDVQLYNSTSCVASTCLNADVKHASLMAAASSCNSPEVEVCWRFVGDALACGQCGEHITVHSVEGLCPNANTPGGVASCLKLLLPSDFLPPSVPGGEDAVAEFDSFIGSNGCHTSCSGWEGNLDAISNRLAAGNDILNDERVGKKARALLTAHGAICEWCELREWKAAQEE